MYVLKVDGSGNEVWSKYVGGPNDDWAYSIGLISTGGIILAGITESYGAGNRDFYLVRLGAAADFDADGDVDLDDYGHFQSCATGPGIGPPAAGCTNADLDHDDDVDQEDFGLFQGCLSGPGVPADLDCPP